MNLKRLAIVTLFALAIGASAYAVTHSQAAEPCCCDFTDGEIVCTITGQELASCCCR